MKVTAGHIELFVSDPVIAKEFYVKALGFSLVEVQAETFVWLSSGELTVLLRPGGGPERGDTYQNAAIGLVLYTDNLPETKLQLEERGVEFLGTDGSDECLTFCDPDGNWFQLVNPGGH